MRKGKLGVYQLMVASKYFETIDDYINLELATKKAKGTKKVVPGRKVGGK